MAGGSGTRERWADLYRGTRTYPRKDGEVRVTYRVRPDSYSGMG